LSRWLCNAFSSLTLQPLVLHLPQGPYLPGYTATPDEPRISYGLHRLDHAVGNVPDLIEQLEHVMGFTGDWQCFVG
jgi:hypothetical protein